MALTHRQMTAMSMVKEETKSLHKYFFWGAVIILFIASYLIIRPYLVALISAFILAFLVKPVYIKLSKKLNKHLSALICVILILLVFIIPFGTILGRVTNQAVQSLDKETLINILKRTSSLLILFGISPEKLGQQLSSLIIPAITSTLFYIPQFILGTIIIVFTTYYLLLNWDYLSNLIRKFIPFKNKEKISNEIAQTTQRIVYGYMLIAIIEFIVAFIGFYISGVKLYFLLPALIALFAFIPGLGPLAVWAPTAIYYLATGDIFTAIGVLITGLVISIGIDYFLVLKLVGKKAQIHTIVLLIGILGGVPLFGLFGIIIGPLILVYAIKFLDEAVKSY